MDLTDVTGVRVADLVEPMMIEAVEIVDDTTLVITVMTGRCGIERPWALELDDRVEVGVRRHLPSDQPCPGVAFIDRHDLELAEPVGDRTVVVHLPSWRVEELKTTESPITPCVFTEGTAICRPLVVTDGAGIHHLTDPFLVADVGVRFGSAPVELALSEGTTVRLRWPAGGDRPALHQRQGLGHPVDGLWGALEIHNLVRELDFAGWTEVSVDGYPGWRQDRDEGGLVSSWIVITVDGWSLDVQLAGTDAAALERAVNELLNRMTITTSAASFPLVDAGGLATSGTEFTVVDSVTGWGVGYSYAPNCDPDERYCVVDLGYLWPALAGEMYVEGRRYMAAPLDLDSSEALDGIDLTLVTISPQWALVDCVGVPALDPALLPEGVTLTEASNRIRIYTGHPAWSSRMMPGVTTEFLGRADNPEAVARHERNADGTWNTVHVTSCR